MSQPSALSLQLRESRMSSAKIQFRRAEREHGGGRESNVG